MTWEVKCQLFLSKGSICGRGSGGVGSVVVVVDGLIPEIKQIDCIPGCARIEIEKTGCLCVIYVKCINNFVSHGYGLE